MSSSESALQAGHGFPTTSLAITHFCSKEDVPVEDSGFPIDLKHVFLAFSCCTCSGWGCDEPHAFHVDNVWPLEFMEPALAGSPTHKAP